MTLDIHPKSPPQSKSLPNNHITYLLSLKICLLVDKVIEKPDTCGQPYHYWFSKIPKTELYPYR